MAFAKFWISLQREFIGNWGMVLISIFGLMFGLQRNPSWRWCIQSLQTMYPRKFENIGQLNVDGAASGNLGPAGGGGLLHNDQGLWLFGFFVNIGYATSLVDKLWALWQSLKLAWDFGFKHLEVESDLKLGISLISSVNPEHAHFNLIWKIRVLLNRD
ncbi:hypothetical protein ACH5RR_038968 [Cinchona calisaya]|uniref:RNase H type-1 domain-containing protein n=1 Tax=Cinchona calisaya TaxID=153742 RepID=A0ABD2Y0Y2_9GENT